MVRFDTFELAPRFDLKAGITINGRERLFPFTKVSGYDFDLVDQRTAPCSLRWIGMDAQTALKVTLTVSVPFRPGDLEFSSTPVLAIQLQVERIPGQFRWTNPDVTSGQPELFVEIGDGALSPVEGRSADEIHLIFKSWLRPDNDPKFPRQNSHAREQRDALVAAGAIRTQRGFRKSVRIGTDESLVLYWCAWPGPALQVDGVAWEFFHARQFMDLDAVVAWARANGAQVTRNARVLDGMIQNHTLGQAVDHLLAYTLHSWAMNTWLVSRGDERWFSVWEGSCYFHSTIDVEFTQAPFYLAVWPELMRLQLRQWASRSLDGSQSLGRLGEGTRFMPHDVGRYAEVGAAAYPHQMEVEETANFLLLLFADWRRSGIDSLVREFRHLVLELGRYLRATDTDGSGVPDLGTANTIDDGSPAIQFGRRQVYLALKTRAALLAACDMLESVLPGEHVSDWRSAAERILARIEKDAWQGDHYGVLVEKAARLRNPWTGAWRDYAEVPGWAAAHIYISNVLPVLDMVGASLGLDPERLNSDLRVSTERCLREYGCIHTDHREQASGNVQSAGLAGSAQEPGWISMNLLRDLAAIRRRITIVPQMERYWEWQVLTNTQGVHLFFETFGGNNLCFYPRGVAVWGIFEAVSETVVDRVAGKISANASALGLKVPELWKCPWSELSQSNEAGSSAMNRTNSVP
jgi:hypothetical protein